MLFNNYIRKDGHEEIKDHSLIRGKNIEDISKPSDKLRILIGRYFESERKGKRKRIQYGKLRSAPGILDQLDIKALLEIDSELQRFRDAVKSKH